MDAAKSVRVPVSRSRAARGCAAAPRRRPRGAGSRRANRRCSRRPCRTSRAATLRMASRSRLPRARRNARGNARVRSQRATLGASAPAGQYNQLPKNGCTGAWIIPKTFFSARMVSSPDAAAQPVVRLDRGGTHPLRADVGDDGVQPPVLGVVDGQLVAGGLGLTTHDQPHGAPEQGRRGRGDLTALLGLAAERRGPDRGRVGGQRVEHRGGRSAGEHDTAKAAAVGCRQRATHRLRRGPARRDGRQWAQRASRGGRRVRGDAGRVRTESLLIAPAGGSGRRHAARPARRRRGRPGAAARREGPHGLPAGPVRSGGRVKRLPRRDGGGAAGKLKPERYDCALLRWTATLR
jgi:hypothetical protein